MMNRNYILASEGSTDWKIVLPADAIPSEKYAAEELQKFLKEISGAEFPVVNDSAAPTEHEIVLGFGPRAGALGLADEEASLGRDGLIMRTVGETLVLAGGRPHGTLNAVYAFLEEVLGCRWFTAEVSRIPKRDTIEIPELNDRQVPVMAESRETYNKCAFNGDWAARNRLMGPVHRLEEKHGGAYRYNQYAPVHTFNLLVPPEVYFDEHPEYFSEIDGVRTKERSQLCLTNPDVLEIATKKVLEWIEMDPEAEYISVSQNDWYNACRCEKCRAIDEAEESGSGTMIWFLNQLAERVCAVYPDKKIGVLAYQYTRKPPKHLKPHPNIVIRLCDIECCFSHPLNECQEIMSFKKRTTSGTTFVEDLVGWGKICEHIHVWDYTTNFMHFLMPFPNFQVLGPNLRFLAENHVTGMFEQGNGDTLHGEMQELRAYVLAKLLWNPYQDTDALILEFLTGYYGMAAGPIYQYMKMLQKKIEDENIHMGIYDQPTTPYLSADILKKAHELFEKAEKLADNEEVLHRVRLAHMGIDYVDLAIMKKDTPGRLEKVAEFFQRVEEEGILYVREDHSNEHMRKVFEECDENMHYHQ